MQFLCKKCVLPESKPYITLNAEGICNICIDFQKRSNLRRDNMLLESELIKIINKHRDKGKYDCLVMCSGGKDSTASLYYIKEKYKLNTLAFTFDHGFENEEALQNIKNAVNILGVDWIYYKTDFMKKIFAKLINSNSTASICHVCAIWYLEFTFDVAFSYNIPLVVAGWTKGQSLKEGESGIEYKLMSQATHDFVNNNLRKEKKYRNFPTSVTEVFKNSQRKFKIQPISPHWFLRYDPNEIQDILQRELKWKAPKLSYPKNSTNCMMNFVSVYHSLKNYGYTHYHIELSKLIRLGEISREEALKLLEFNYDIGFMNSILGPIGCKLDL